jgi:hypothetical protein
MYGPLLYKPTRSGFGFKLEGLVPENPRACLYISPLSFNEKSERFVAQFREDSWRHDQRFQQETGTLAGGVRSPSTWLVKRARNIQTETLPSFFLEHDPEKPVLDLIGDGHQFPAFAKPASAGEGRSEKIMLRQKYLCLRSPGQAG